MDVLFPITYKRKHGHGKDGKFIRQKCKECGTWGHNTSQHKQSMQKKLKVCNERS